jgi:hypothetical protein
MVLTPAEITNLETATHDYNSAIASEATTRRWAVLDLYSLFKQTAANGVTVGGQHYTTAFVSGGIFGLDGVHPSDLGYGIITNAMIDAVNAKYGASIPHVDLATCLTASSYRMHPVTTGHMPYIEHAEAFYARMFPRPGVSMP